MWIQKKQGGGCDIICDCCGKNAALRIMVGNVIRGEVCLACSEKIAEVVASQLKTRPEMQADVDGFILDPSGLKPTDRNVVGIFGGVSKDVVSE